MCVPTRAGPGAVVESEQEHPCCDSHYRRPAGSRSRVIVGLVRMSSISHGLGLGPLRAQRVITSPSVNVGSCSPRAVPGKCDMG